MTKDQLDHTINAYLSAPTRANAQRVIQATAERRHTLAAQHMRMCMEVATQEKAHDDD